MPDQKKKFGAVIIDPPYQRFGVEKYYPTMSDEEILAMAPTIADLLKPDAMVWLWVANSNIVFGTELLAAMGARYSSMLSWIKPRIGRGRPLRSSTEHVLLGLIGKPEVLFRGQGTWMFAPVQDPSHKPEELHAVIERLTPGPYLELFARRARPGWSVWGNQLEKSDVVLAEHPVPGEHGERRREAA
jgi:N6-adenosine-specific RNA methylase IME4